MFWIKQTSELGPQMVEGADAEMADLRAASSAFPKCLPGTRSHQSDVKITKNKIVLVRERD